MSIPDEDIENKKKPIKNAMSGSRTLSSYQCGVFCPCVTCPLIYNMPWLYNITVTVRSVETVINLFYFFHIPHLSRILPTYIQFFFFVSSRAKRTRTARPVVMYR